MKIFVGSSLESAKTMKLIAKWLRPHTAVKWNAQDAFRPETGTWDELHRHTQTVDGAIFVFAQDDVKRIRGKVEWTTRDNIWLEYGLFVGALGRNRVLRIHVGNPRIASDLKGIKYIKWPVDAAEGKKRAEAKQDVKDWAKKLPPASLRKLASDVAMQLAGRAPVRVAEVLKFHAPKFMDESRVSRIRALCSNKGQFSDQYYGGQFFWVNRKGTERTLRRIFVRNLQSERGLGFSPGERKGILVHLKQSRTKVEIRWVFENAARHDLLGFALFGEKKWIVHWGLRFGYCYGCVEDGDVGKHIAKHFDRLWKDAKPFERDLVQKLKKLEAMEARSRRRK